MKMIHTLSIITLLILIPSTIWAGADEIDRLPDIAPDAIRVFIVRHAETYHQIQKLDSNSDLYYKLTPNGEKQSKTVGFALRKEPIVACYSSETERTRKTLQLTGLASLNGLKAIEEKAFNRPIDGKLEDGSTSTFSWRIEQWSQGRDPQPEGGETLAQATNRCYKYIRSIDHAYGKAIIVVTHGDVIAGMVGAADKVPVWDRWERFNAASCTICVVDVYKDGPAILRAFAIDPSIGE